MTSTESRHPYCVGACHALNSPDPRFRIVEDDNALLVVEARWHGAQYNFSLSTGLLTGGSTQTAAERVCARIGRVQAARRVVDYPAELVEVFS